MPSLAEAFADVVSAEGLTHAFGLLGEGNLHLVRSLTERTGCTWVGVRREDAAVCAADGYAQGTGGLGLALVTHGPALINALNPLVSTLKGGSPVVLVTGELGDDERWHPQWIDQGAAVRAFGVDYVTVTEAEDPAEVIRRAFLGSVRNCAPVVLGLPTRLQTRAVTGGVSPVPCHRKASELPGRRGEGSPLPDIGAIEAAARLLCAAESPVIIAGRGALTARAQLAELSRRTGAVLTTTLLARGLFAGESADFGTCGGFARPLTRRLVRGADVVVAFGASLSPYTTDHGRLLRGARVIHVDADPSAFGRHVVPDVVVLGDVALAAESLVVAVDPAPMHRRLPTPPGSRRDDFDDRSGPSGLDLRTVACLLDESLPDDRGLVMDLGYFTSEPATAVRVLHPRRHAFPLHFGSIGVGLATAIGLAAADPSVSTLCAVGDGGLLAAAGELETLRRTALPVVVAVFNDSAYGVELHALRGIDAPTDLSRFPPVDFAAVAQAFGLPALTVRTLDQADDVRRALAAPRGPLLVDFKTNPEIVTEWYRRITAPDEFEEIPR